MPDPAPDGALVSQKNSVGGWKGLQKNPFPALLQPNRSTVDRKNLLFVGEPRGTVSFPQFGNKHPVNCTLNNQVEQDVIQVVYAFFKSLIVWQIWSNGSYIPKPFRSETHMSKAPHVTAADGAATTAIE